MKVLIINGPNLNFLDKREQDHYGEMSLPEMERLIRNEFPEIEFAFYQSNIEGEIITRIQEADKLFNGIIINPGGYAHTSVAILDALALCKIPKVEVHLSNLSKREDFRQRSLTARNCNGYVSGLKEISYLAGIYSLIQIIKSH
ncbi:MAG: 3-dehydroquinate dehydratase [Ignavibacterium sp.]|nr:3-dehydroquinate dehydratase [Ignavibacterium sp.]